MILLLSFQVSTALKMCSDRHDYCGECTYDQSELCTRLRLVKCIFS